MELIGGGVVGFACYFHLTKFTRIIKIASKTKTANILGLPVLLLTDQDNNTYKMLLFRHKQYTAIKVDSEYEISGFGVSVPEINLNQRVYDVSDPDKPMMLLA